jgi:hypothetical protein
MKQAEIQKESNTENENGVSERRRVSSSLLLPYHTYILDPFSKNRIG